VTKSHSVQSVRAVVENTIADVKQWKVMEGNKVSTVKQKEQELDCVIGLHNLRQLLKMNPDFDIPTRRNAIPDEHIFKPRIAPEDVDLKIPAAITPKIRKTIPHVLKFEQFLSSAAPAAKRALERYGKEHVFFPNVGKRGRNLYEGAYVLQLRVQEENADDQLDVWTVQYIVGASYSFESYKGYFQMSKDEAVLCNICECYSG